MFPRATYYYDAVLWAVGRAASSPARHKRHDLLDPSGSCTRAQIVTFLWRAAGSPVVNYADARLTDVDERRVLCRGRPLGGE